ncbi:hypothetical protein OT109_15280 [Phycisphaeraceae bacterium D3-23]
MTQALHNAAHDDPTLTRALGEAVRGVGAAEGSVLLLDQAGKTLRFALCASPAAAKLVGTEQPVTRGGGGACGVVPAADDHEQAAGRPATRHERGRESGHHDDQPDGGAAVGQ